MNVGGGGLHAGANGFDITLGDLVFEFGHVAGVLQLGDRALEAQGFFRNLVAGCFGLLGGFAGFRLSLFNPLVLGKIQEREMDGHTDGSIVGLKVCVVGVIVVIGGEFGVLGGKINARP